MRNPGIAPGFLIFESVNLRILSITLLSFLCTNSFGQGLIAVSSSSSALAKSDIVSPSGDVFAINPASSHTDSANRALVSLTYSSFIGGLSGASQYAAGAVFALPDISTSVGVSFVHFGFDDLIKNETMSLTLSHEITAAELRRSSIGLRARYETIGFTPEYETIDRLICDFGVEMFFTKEFAVGFSTLNLFGTSVYTQIEEEILPRTFALGVEYTPDSLGLSFNTKLEKQTDRGLLGRFGIAYHPFSFLTLRTGVTTAFRSYHFGFGVLTGGLLIEAAFGYALEIPETASIGVSYAW